MFFHQICNAVCHYKSSTPRARRPLILTQRQSFSKLNTRHRSLLTISVKCAIQTAFLAIATVVFSEALNAQSPGILVPTGFRVEHYADDDLAHDIQCMTFDTKGRVVVSGPGYVRILIDSDNDGKADTFKQFADGPNTGCQGMHFMGPHLLCTGDEGVLIYRDENGDDRADGPPTTILKVAAGGEHNVHSIQRGPDGLWYIIAGNMSGVTGSYASLATSPLKTPESGVLMRLKPDLSEGEILSDGFRNAYDFAFNPVGDVFTFDSDGERDVSLPWYLPCRVFHVTPRSNAGWVSRSWKRPNDFPDMPPVVGAFGRGSPTGVVSYRHLQFPSRYDGALFVLDWTFGRVLALTLEEKDGLWNGTPSVFAMGTGNFGFAPTDIEVGPDGSLYVSVGGRGTRGSVFRFVCTENQVLPAVSPAADATAVEQLNFVLSASQPESSWSLAQWLPAAINLGKSAFVSAATDEGRRPIQRVRAIEILTSVFDGLDPATARTLTSARSAPVRARTAWSIGRTNPSSPDVDAMYRLLDDQEPLVARFALEALMTVQDQQVLDKCLPLIAVALGSPNPAIRKAAANTIAVFSVQQRDQIAQLIESNLTSKMWLALGTTARTRQASLPGVGIALQSLQEKHESPEDLLVSLRLLQLSLGDVGPQTGIPAAFESYTARGDLQVPGLPLNELRKTMADRFPSGNSAVDRELVRNIAILGSSEPALIEKLLATITSETSPSDDIHRMAALSRIQTPRTLEQSDATARALVNLDLKIVQQQLKQDSNWDARLIEFYEALCSADPMISETIGAQPGFGFPGHVLFLRNISPDRIQQAIDGFATQIESNENYEWNRDVVFVLARSNRKEHLTLIRSQLDNLSIQEAVLTVMARDPLPEDRQFYIEGLASAQPTAIAASLNALTKLPRSVDAAEQHALLATVQQLNHDENEFRLRELAIRLLQNNLSQSFEFVFGKAGHKPQPDAIHRWADYLKSRFPDFTPPLQGGQESATVLSMLNDVAWDSGDAVRGKQLFTKLSCAKCHGGRRALGPDLQGVTKRFSRDDLFASIVDPNRDISARYQLTTIVTRSGKTYSGLIVYESVDGVILRDAEQNTSRIEAADIETQIKRRASLMPNGLLRNVTQQNLADLDAYLRSL